MRSVINIESVAVNLDQLIFISLNLFPKFLGVKINELFPNINSSKTSREDGWA